MSGRHYLSCIFIFSLLCRQSGQAQAFNPNYHFRQLTVDNGLPQNIVDVFYEDSHGFVWIGTDGGLARFDGTNTTLYESDPADSQSIRGNYILGILEDKKGDLWIGTEVALNRYSRETNRFQAFYADSSGGKPIPGFYVPFYIDDQEEIWITNGTDRTGGYALRFDTHHQRFAKVPQLYGVRNLTNNGIAPWKKVSAIYNFRSFQVSRFSVDGGLVQSQNELIQKSLFPQPSPPVLITGVVPEADTLVWFSCDRGLIAYNPIRHSFQNYNHFGAREFSRFTTLAVNPWDQSLWIGTENEGILIFDRRQRRFVQHLAHDDRSRETIVHDHIYTIYFDSKSNVWIGTYGFGASYAYLGQRFFTEYPSRTELDVYQIRPSVCSIAEDAQGMIYCGLNDDARILVLNAQKELARIIRPFERKQGHRAWLSKTDNKIFIDREGQAWLYNARGIYTLNLASGELEALKYKLFSEDVFGSRYVNEILELDDGRLIFTTYNGIYTISREDGKFLVAPFENLNDEEYRFYGAVARDPDGRIYAVMHNIRVDIMEPGHGHYRKIASVPLTADITGILQGNDTHSLWLVSAEGLFELNTSNFQLKLHNHIPGVTTHYFKSAAKDPDGGIWMASNRGIIHLDPLQLKGNVYTTADGLPTNEFNDAAISNSRTGEILMGSSFGLTAFNPKSIREEPLGTDIYISKVLVRDIPLAGNRNPDEILSYTLPYASNTISFEYAALEYINPQNCVYSYRMNAIDKDWIYAGRNRIARYANLSPGQYLFQVRVGNSQGKWSDKVKNIQVIIGRPFWMEWWFRGVILLLLGILVFLVSRAITRRILQKQRMVLERQQAIEKERTRIATDMHDDLGAGLSRIKFLSETIGLKKQMQQPVEEDISSIGQYANEMISKMGEIVWALNEKNDSLSDLLSYTRSYAAEYLLQNGIDCKVNLPSQMPPQFVSGEFRRNVYLAIKEALHNIVKHAQAKKVTIDIRVDRALKVTIQDDGIGFDPTRIRPFSNGLNNMQKRMQEIGGSLDIEHGHGIRVQLTAPLMA